MDLSSMRTEERRACIVLGSEKEMGRDRKTGVQPFQERTGKQQALMRPYDDLPELFPTLQTTTW